jgi:hypothetical protein
MERRPPREPRSMRKPPPPVHYAEVSKQRVPLAFDQIKYDPTFKGINLLIF